MRRALALLVLAVASQAADAVLRCELVADAGSRGYRGETPTGVHKGYDAAGRLRTERYDDERSRIKRERDLDESSATARDDEVFEDGSRKALAR